MGVKEGQHIVGHTRQRVDFVHPETLMLKLVPLILHIRCRDADSKSHFHQKSKGGAKPKDPRLRDGDAGYGFAVEVTNSSGQQSLRCNRHGLRRVMFQAAKTHFLR